MNHKKRRRILAVIGIILLAAMYVVNLVLALIGTEWSRQALKGTIVLSIAFPILLYAFLLLMKKNPGGTEEEQLTREEKDEIYRLIEEKEARKDGRSDDRQESRTESQAEARAEDRTESRTEDR